MPYNYSGRTIYSLYEIAYQIQEAIDSNFPDRYWIVAEMNKLNHYPHSGHCYPDLIEKKEGKLIAQIRGNLWRSTYQAVQQKFLTVLREPLKDGIKILFLAEVRYHPVYGLSLNILDIDPYYTLGDLEREKQETIEKLKHQGIFDRNKTLQLPILPQRIAVISVETSKGYADFCNVLNAAASDYGYAFFHMLFPALLQGDQAVPSILNQLKKIKMLKHHFDMVAIIRGGGGDVGLSCYNNYDLAREIALFPLPVLTGIGHSTNLTVAEMVACKNAITPTKLGEIIIQRFHDFAQKVQEAEDTLMQWASEILQSEQQNLNNAVKNFRNLVRLKLQEQHDQVAHLTKDLKYFIRLWHHDHLTHLNRLIKSLADQCRKTIILNQTHLVFSSKTIRLNIQRNLSQSEDMLIRFRERIGKAVSHIFEKEKLNIQHMDQTIDHLHPKNILRRGYSITRLNGRAITRSNQVPKGAVIETELYEGKLTSKVQ